MVVVDVAQVDPRCHGRLCWAEDYRRQQLTARRLVHPDFTLEEGAGAHEEGGVSIWHLLLRGRRGGFHPPPPIGRAYAKAALAGGDSGDLPECAEGVIAGQVGCGGDGERDSIAAEGGFRCDVERTMAMIAKGGSVRGKLAEVQTSDGKTHYSFLSLTWGLLADIDLDSEFLRFMGGARFDVYAAMRLCWIKTHRAKLQ